MNVAQIDAARKSQRATIARIRDDLARADAAHDWPGVGRLRGDLAQAQRVAVRLHQMRGAQTTPEKTPYPPEISSAFGDNRQGEREVIVDKRDADEMAKVIPAGEMPYMELEEDGEEIAA